MQCCAAVRATCRKQQTHQLWMEGRGGERGAVCFVLWSCPVWVLMSQHFCCRLYIPMARHNMILYFPVIIHNADMYLILLINILWLQVERFTESQIDGIDFIVSYPYSNSPLLLYILNIYHVPLLGIFICGWTSCDWPFTQKLYQLFKRRLTVRQQNITYMSKLSKLDWVMEYY